METAPKPGLWNIFSILLLLGIQSFGGGSSTFYLIHQACITRGWLNEEEFVRNWALAQIAPGINLLKLTVLIGQKLRGWQGIVAAVSGLLLPSAGVTVLMTAGFAVIRDQPLVKAALRGILPATIGLSIAMAVQMAQPVFTRAYQEGYARLSANVVIMICSGVLLAANLVSPVLVLLLAGLAAVMAMAVIPSRAKTQPAGSE
jgi:chromate transporter